MRKNLVIIALLIVGMVLVSGCSQPSKKPTETNSPEKTPIKATGNAPLPTDISVSGDSLGTELARSDAIDSDLQDPDFETVGSDLSEIENSL